MPHAEIILGLALLFGLFMAWGVGANDVANAMGTSVGSKAITLRQAIVIATLFEAGGALLAGGQVTDTIRGQIIAPHFFSQQPELFVLGMLSSLLAAAVWLMLASYLAWPVSTTHSIVGAIMGFALIEFGANSIYWHEVINIFLSWLLTPFISGLIAFFIFRSIQILILETKKPFYNAKKFLPFYVFLVGFVMSYVTLNKGLKHVGLDLSSVQSIGIATIFSLLLLIIALLIVRQQESKADVPIEHDFASVEKIFGLLMIFTACAMAFAHGSNDVANAIGPLAAIHSVVASGGDISQQSGLPFWILVLGAIGIVIGLASYGYRVIATIGENITELTPSRGFAAELATASTVVVASGFGLPISTTQTLVGGVLGVGFARGIGALNLRVISNIFLSWVITLPSGAILSVVFYNILKLFLT